MHRPSFETLADGRATIPREFAIWLRLATLVAVALLLVRGAEAIGLVSSVDAFVEDRQLALAQSLGVSRESSDAVIVIAGDRETIAAWGPPPWSNERLDRLLAAIEAGEPDRVVVLGHAPMFLTSWVPGFTDGQPPRVLGLGRTSSSWSIATTDSRALRLGPNTTLRELGRVSEGVPEVPEILPIRWLTPANRLPVIPAEQVAAGRIPPSTFTGRIVVLGVTDPVHARPLATPLGPLSPVEIEAHALSGWMDGRVVAGLPRPWAYLGCGVLAMVLVVALGRVRLGFVVLGASLGLAAVFAATFTVKFTGGFTGELASSLGELPSHAARIGLGRPTLTLAATLAGFAVAELAPLAVGLRRTRARVVHELARFTAGEDRPASAGSDQGWAELAEIAGHYARAVLGAHAVLEGELSTTLLERDADSWRVFVRASTPDAELESYPNALDLRRAPLRSVWLTARAGWSSGVFAASPGKTLIIPLARAGVLVGIWLVHMPEWATPTAAAVARCERLGRQMAAAIVRRRLREGLDQDRRPSLGAELATIEAGLTLIRDEHRWALELLEQLPVRAAIATVWGELEFVDPRLRQALATRCPGLFHAHGPPPNLVEVLAGLTGAGRDAAQGWLREVVRDGTTLELDPSPSSGSPPNPHERWLLAPLEARATVDRTELGPVAVEHLLLSLIPPIPERQRGPA